MKNHCMSLEGNSLLYIYMQTSCVMGNSVTMKVYLLHRLSSSLSLFLTHIWSYVGGYTDFLSAHNTCLCIHSDATQPPECVGDNYYCESANEAELKTFEGQFFAADKLWDGQQCDHEDTCCTAKSPPWFSVIS